MDINNENSENFNNIPDDDSLNSSSETEVIDSSIPDDISEKFSEIENELLENAGEKPKTHREHRNGNVSKILLVIFTAAILIIICVFSVYSIIIDIKDSADSGRIYSDDITLKTYSKPHEETISPDENGKYTTEGIAQLMKPAVVEIFSFSSDDTETPKSGGSGIIITSDGYIITNAHLLEDMSKFVVSTFDKKEYPAQVIGQDKKTDLAVIKINAQGLNAAELGNSDEIVQGEAVAAVGNPAGLNGSITSGVVSGLDRMIKSSLTGFQMNCIQTDAAISPGNSGGALVNMYGQVIGITSSKYASAASEGLGFAISINDAKPIIEELIAKGYVSGRVKIGITFFTPYGGFSELKFKEDMGFEMPDEVKNAIWIETIDSKCDIANTELKEGDFIVSLDGKALTGYEDISKVLEGKKAGDTVSAECIRVTKDQKTEHFKISFKLMEDTGSFIQQDDTNETAADANKETTGNDNK